MTTNANNRCYACAKSGLALDDLRYECMCIDRVGVCRACEKVPIAPWKIPFAPGHALRRRHDLAPEYLRVMDEVQRKCGKPFMTEFEGQTMTVSYYAGPDGEIGAALAEYLRANGIGDGEPDAVYRLPRERKKQLLKTAGFTLPDKTCTCCD